MPKASPKSEPSNSSAQNSYASPGFCRIDDDGIHILNRYKGEHLINWNEVIGVEKPRGNCRHDYLKVVTMARHFKNPVPVADRENASVALEAIRQHRPDIA